MLTFMPDLFMPGFFDIIQFSYLVIFTVGPFWLA